MATVKEWLTPVEELSAEQRIEQSTIIMASFMKLPPGKCIFSLKRWMELMRVKYNE